MKRSQPTILFVDDDPNDHLFMQLGFQTAGIPAKLQIAPGGAEAIAYLKGEGKYSDRLLYEYPGFVITDLKMPDVDGFGVVDFMRRNLASATVPVVVLSGSQDNDDMLKAYLLGASSYHVKPTVFAELCTLLKTLHDYWMMCDFPAAGWTLRRWDREEYQKLGERFFGTAPARRISPRGDRANSGTDPSAPAP